MQTASTLRLIEEGMKVFDRERHEIGKVEYVRFGEDDPETPEIESNGEIRQADDSLIDNFVKAFTVDEVPEELRERLINQGFVRIDANGLFAADRYITPEQIASVSGDGLMLNVTKDELIKRH